MKLQQLVCAGFIFGGPQFDRNKNLMRLLYILYFLPVLAAAQEQTEVPDMPVPYNPKPYYGNNNATGVKKVIMISEKKESGFKADTLYKYSYNRAGQLDTLTRYDAKGLYSLTAMRYDKYNNLVEWTLYEKDGRETNTRFYYNRFNKPDSTRQLKYQNRIESYTSRSVYTYEDEKLRQHRMIFNELAERVGTYRYNNDLLMEYKVVPGSLASFISTYTYDSAARLTEKNIVHYFNDRSELWNNKNSVIPAAGFPGKKRPRTIISS